MSREAGNAAMSREATVDYRRVQWALRFFALTHLLAMPLLALWLQPGLNAGVPLIERARYVAEHVWLWRLGWVGWQLCALSDLLLSGVLLGWARRRGVCITSTSNA